MVEHDTGAGSGRGATPQRDALLSDEMRLKLLRLFEGSPQASQRDAARELGISLGKVNYCLQALVHKGWIKSNRFRNSRDKFAYRYLLTPRGVEAKAALTVRFLRIKMREYETLRTEIEQLRREAATRGRERGVSQL
jgi:EPS-associated MarR family transcriptional regulator